MILRSLDTFAAQQHTTVSEVIRAAVIAYLDEFWEVPVYGTLVPTPEEIEAERQERAEIAAEITRLGEELGA